MASLRPMQGARLDLVLSDELSFGEWRAEFPQGQVLAPVTKYSREYDSNWEPEVAKLPVVISFPGTELKSRDVVIGITVNGAARAYPWDSFVKQSPIMDRVNGTPLLIALGPDGKSFRTFVGRVNGQEAEFFLQTESEPNAESPGKQPNAGSVGEKPREKSAGNSEDTKSEKSEDQSQDKSHAGAPAAENQGAKRWVLIDSVTASQWNFQGCAISGPAQGQCLDRLPALKDYWFDWRNYHRETTVYKG